MKININSVHFKTDKKLVNYINEKVSKLTKRHEEIIGTDVTLKIENTDSDENKISEIRLIIKGYDLFAKKQSKSFEEATDSAVEALKKQITKHKEKIRNR
jgi:putative sigma-54 modulation protein